MFLLLTACLTQSTELETRTFTLSAADPHQAATLVEPYVDFDRPGQPGQVKYSNDPPALTVRETSDNLDRIERMLAEVDVAAPGVSLHVRLVEANGPGEDDERLADIRSDLEGFLRYDGYALLGEARLLLESGAHFEQRIDVGGEHPAKVEGVLRVHPGDPPEVAFSFALETPFRDQISNSFKLPMGETVVVGGSSRPGEDGEQSALLVVMSATPS